MTEISLDLRYFTKIQVRAKLLIAPLGTLTTHGSVFKRAIRQVIGLILLQNTIRQIAQRRKQAEAFLGKYPQIPSLGEIDHLQTP